MLPHPSPAADTFDPPPIPRAWFGLAVLFGMNLLNYMDRYVFFSVGESIQRELSFTDSQYAWLSVSFMLVYTFISPLMGWLGDRYHRRRLLALGVGLWSLATVGTAFSGSFWPMFSWRALLGVGEASYGVIAPALLSDLFPPRLRGRVIGIYFLALPLGGALGYLIGGELTTQFGWQAPFFVVGLPGLFLAVAGLVIPDPGRGASEGRVLDGPIQRPRLSDYLSLLRNRTFLQNVGGMAAVTFVTGAYAAWGATFYQRVHGLTPAQAGRWIGGMTALAGLVGIGFGTWLADQLRKATRRAYMLLAAFCVFIAIPFATFAILDPFWRSSLPFLFVAMILMAMVLGPSNTVTANVVPAQLRAAGFALAIFLLHLFGDISSPILIGYVSEFLGRPSIASSAVGRLLAQVGATVESTANGPTNLTAGMLAVIPAMLVGGFFFLRGSRHLPDAEDRAHEASVHGLGREPRGS